jgi:hypothetical protein
VVNEIEKLNTKEAFENREAGELKNLQAYPIEIAIPNINQYPNEVYAMIRKLSLGASDSSAVLGVSPFTSRNDLINEKVRHFLTAEEKAIGDKVAVRKGVDCEPIIIAKFEQYYKQKTIKPIHMYRFKDYPWLAVNFDGVTGTSEQYLPAEIKVVTAYGEKHYEPKKALFSELEGFRPLPEDPSSRNWSIETKAAYYGIPPYYYTQLQQQIFALNAPFGFLSVLFDKDWRFYSYFIWRDQPVINALIIESYKVWEIIEARRGPNWLNKAGLEWTLTVHSPDTPSGTEPEV